MRRARAFASSCLVALALAAPSAAEDAATAAAAADPAALRAPVDRLYAALDEAMQRADALGFDGRYQLLAPTVTASYDVPFMAQLILGSEWRRLSPDQQGRWVETFTRFTVSTYADRFDHPGVRFEISATEPAAQGTQLVRTTLHPEKDDPVKLDYRVRSSADGWRIVDVYLSGTVSELALRRSEYSALIKREGFEALLAAMEKKIATAKAGTAEEAGAP